MKYLLLVTAALLLLPLAAWGEDASSPVKLPPRKAFHLYLLIGQSNMAGRGLLDDEAKTAHPRVLKFTKENEWGPGMDPLHFDKVDPRGLVGAGLGLPFARAMAEAKPEATIGLIPCAVGGTPLSRWVKGGDLYARTLVRARLALKDGELKGILWHQGEGDSSTKQLATSYAERLAQMVQDLRADLGVNDAPFVAGKLGEFLKRDYQGGRLAFWPVVNEQIASLPELVSRVAVVESTGLTHKGDDVHFDTPSLREFGKRYAAAMQNLEASSEPSAAAQPADASGFAEKLLGSPETVRLKLAEGGKLGLIEIAPVHLPIDPPGDCNHYGWPIATLAGDTLVVMHRRIPGHNPRGAGGPNEQMSYGVVLTSGDGGKTWSPPYDLRDCMSAEDRNRGGVVPLSHRAKFDKENKSTQGYKVHLHSIGTARDGAVVAINNHGVFCSEDAGRTWKHFSTALRDDTFPHEIVNLGPNLIDHPEHGLCVFGNWFGERNSYNKFSDKLVALTSRDGGGTWQVEEHDAGFLQYEPATLLHQDKFLFISRDQKKQQTHTQMSWQPGEKPRVLATNLVDPKYLDTADFSFNPVTERFEVVRSERYRMELWLWSMDPADWEQGQWRRECRLLAHTGKFYTTADGYHPAGAVIDAKRGVQHLFVYSGHPNGPAGVFRITRTLDTEKLKSFLANVPPATR